MKTFETSYGVVSCFDNDESFVRSMQAGKMFEQDLFEQHVSHHIKNATIILDVGAHIGSHTLMYARVNPSSTILAFEPQEPVFGLLSRNVAANSLTHRIRLFNNAVGNQEKTVYMEGFSRDGLNANRRIEYDGPAMANIGGMSVSDDSVAGQAVQCITIDGLNLDACDYIKIDVEGYERQVLDGARETIRKFRPLIMYEHNEKHVPSSIVHSPHDLIQTMGPYIIQNLPDANFLAIPQMQSPRPTVCPPCTGHRGPSVSTARSPRESECASVSVAPSWFKTLADKIGVVCPDVFVETGTYNGDGIQRVVHDFRTVHSIELKPSFAHAARDRFRDCENVQVHCGDSADVLRALSKITEPVMFYLDAHFAGGETERGSDSDNGCPLLRELQVLKDRPFKGKGDVIVIDDMRLIGRVSTSGTPGCKMYPVTTFDWTHVTVDNIMEEYGTRVRQYWPSDIDRLVLY